MAGGPLICALPHAQRLLAAASAPPNPAIRRPAPPPDGMHTTGRGELHCRHILFAAEIDAGSTRDNAKLAITVRLHLRPLSLLRCPRAMVWLPGASSLTCGSQAAVTRPACPRSQRPNTGHCGTWLWGELQRKGYRRVSEGEAQREWAFWWVVGGGTGREGMQQGSATACTPVGRLTAAPQTRPLPSSHALPHPAQVRSMRPRLLSRRFVHRPPFLHHRHALAGPPPAGGRRSAPAAAAGAA